MDSQKKPTKLTLWESFVEHDGTKIVKQLHDYPIILVRKVARPKSSSGLTTRFNMIIEINPPYPQVASLRTWAKTNEHLLIAYTAKSGTTTGSLLLVPFENEIIPVASAHQQLSGQVFCIQAEFSLPDENQQFCVVSCSDCKNVFIRIHSRRIFYCVICKRCTNLVPRCQFEVFVTDNSGSATAPVADELAETMLHISSEEVYDIRYIKEAVRERLKMMARKRKLTKTQQAKELPLITSMLRR